MTEALAQKGRKPFLDSRSTKRSEVDWIPGGYPNHVKLFFFHLKVVFL